MTYPLLFFNGEFGLNIELRRNQQQQAAIHRAKLLFQQYLVEAYTKIEGNELTYIRTHQAQLRVESYQGLVDHVHRQAETEDANVGRIVILPSTFEGSPRNMHQNYLDAMTIVTKYGKPNIFLTMTATPNRPEVRENILPHQTAIDIPGVISRFFHLKLKKLLCDLLQRTCGCIFLHNLVSDAYPACCWFNFDIRTLKEMFL